MAALAHGSIVVSGMGIVVAAVIWLTQKEKFPFASREARQATFFQVFAMGLVILSWIVWSVLYSVALILMIASMPKDSEPGLLFWLVTMSWILPMLFMGVLWIFGIRGAWRSWHGQGYRYPITGRLIGDEPSSR